MQLDPPYSYETHEWIHHTQVLFARSLSRHRRPGLAEAEAFFRSGYVDSFEAAWRRRRFVAAMVYLDHHIDALDSGRVAVAGRLDGHVPDFLILALYRYFAHATDDMLSKPPKPEHFIAECS